MKSKINRGLGQRTNKFLREASERTAYEPVSAEVEAYTPIIRLYAQRYGVGEYVELIKAIMMQESCGRGLDPMQASESGYNTRYLHSPNAITDPEYSIDVGVQTVADSLRQAGVESPLDMENIKLALQGYNYGNGFISWARANYGGYTPIAAIEFSDMMAARLGWAGYGDKQYVAHVLRYYPIGHAFTTGNNHAIVEVALTQIGNVGGEPYWSWWGLSYRVEWCAMFVSWCADQCGYLDAGVLPKMEGVIPYVEWFQVRGQWQNGSFEPVAGDIIFFISSILHQAEKEMYVMYNAAERATPPKAEKKKPDYYQPDELTRIIHALDGAPLKWKAITYILIDTGCRRGEVMGLKWESVDLSSRILTIERALLYTPQTGIFEGPPKNGESRTIRIAPETADMISNWKIAQEKMRTAAGQLWTETGYVFTKENGNPMLPDSITQWLADFSKSNSLPHIHPHAFRHTVASTMIADGIDLVTAASELGHADATTTAKIYAHQIAEARAKAAEVRSNVFARAR